MADSPNTHLGLTNKEWAAAGLGGASLLPMLFGGGDQSLDQYISRLESQTDKATATSKELDAQGSDILQPVAKYLKDVTSGDRQAVLSATMPERRRIIDQYDTAKRAIAEFSPRGGGQASAMSALLTSEASDLAATTGAARKEGFSAATNLGVALKQLGVSEDQIASGNIQALIQAALTKNEQDQQGGFNLGSALGSLVGIFL